jgi:hypothetical protein
MDPKHWDKVILRLKTQPPAPVVYTKIINDHPGVREMQLSEAYYTSPTFRAVLKPHVPVIRASL